MKNIKNIDLMDKKTLIKYYITYGGLFSFIGYMLFKNIFISLLFCSISIFYRKEYERTVSQKNKERLLEEFKDFLYSISTSISAGRQMENEIYHNGALRILRLLTGLPEAAGTVIQRRMASSGRISFLWKPGI